MKNNLHRDPHLSGQRIQKHITDSVMEKHPSTGAPLYVEWENQILAHFPLYGKLINLVLFTVEIVM
jgi:hypothetical protein